MESRHLPYVLFFAASLSLTASSHAQVLTSDNDSTNNTALSSGTGSLHPNAPITPQSGMLPKLPFSGSGSADPYSVSTPADLPTLDANGAIIPPEGTQVDTEAGYKKWRFAPIVGTGYVYDDNIFISHTNPVGSQIFKVAGGLSFDYGDFKAKKDTFLTFDYLGVGSFYGQAPAQNTYNDGYILSAQYTWKKFWLLLDSAYTYFNGASVQTGTFTKSTILNNSLHGFYQYSDKTVLDCEIKQISNLYPNNFNSYDNSAKLGFNYQTTEKLKLGMDAIVGFNPSENSPTRTYQTLNARLQYNLTEKFNVKASAGIMASEFETGGQPISATPVFSIGGDYIPFTPTTISFLLYRNYNNSPIYNSQDYLATGLNFNVTQQVFNHWSVSLGVNYENDTYVPNQSGVSSSRKDNTFSIRPTISYSFLKFLKTSIYYQNSFNDSTLSTYSWSDNQYGIELRTTF